MGGTCKPAISVTEYYPNDDQQNNNNNNTITSPNNNNNNKQQQPLKPNNPSSPKHNGLITPMTNSMVLLPQLDATTSPYSISNASNITSSIEQPQPNKINDNNNNKSSYNTINLIYLQNILI